MTTTKTGAGSQDQNQYGSPPEGWHPNKSAQERIAKGEGTLQEAWDQECQWQAGAEARAAEAVARNEHYAEQKILAETFFGKRQFTFMDGNKAIHLGLDQFRSPLKEHPVFRDAIAKNPPFIRIMETVEKEGGHQVTQMHMIRKELFDKSLPEIFSKNLHLEEVTTFRGRLSCLSTGEKLWAGANAALAALFLYQAVDHFRHTQQQDPETGEKKTNWSNVTWGTVSAALSALSMGLVANAFKGGAVR